MHLHYSNETTTIINETTIGPLSVVVGKMPTYANCQWERIISSWLTSLWEVKWWPKRSNLRLNKQYFQDAILEVMLRYNFLIPNRAISFICGELNTVDHTLIWKKGPFVNCRHNRLRDIATSSFIAALLNKCLPEVSTEPPRPCWRCQVLMESLPRWTTLKPSLEEHSNTNI